MKLPVKKGVDAAKVGMKAMKIGKTALGLKQKLPGEKRKASQKALEKAMKKEAKQELHLKKKNNRKLKNRKAVQKSKGMGRIALAVWRKYF